MGSGVVVVTTNKELVQPCKIYNQDIPKQYWLPDSLDNCDLIEKYCTYV